VKAILADFTTYLERLVAHAWPQLGGSGAALLTAAAGEPNGWSRLLSVIVAIVLGLWAFFAAWREEHQKRLTAEQELDGIQNAAPLALLRIFVEGSRVMLSVTNDGAQGMFRVSMETEAGSVRVIRRTSAVWEETNSDHPILIVPTLSARVQLASIDEDHMTYRDNDGEETPHTWGWTINALSVGQGYKPGRLPRQGLQEAGGDFCTLRVTVFSEPQMKGNFAVKRLRFTGREVIDLDSSERHRPTPIIFEDPDEDDFMNGF